MIKYDAHVIRLKEHNINDKGIKLRSGNHLNKWSVLNRKGINIAIFKK